MTSETQWELTELTEHEIPAAAAVIRAYELHYAGLSETTPDFVAAILKVNPDFDMARDAVGATIAGALVAVGTVEKRRAFVIVHPDREGLGIGTAMLQWAETRMAELGVPVYRQGIPAPNVAGARLLDSAGYTRERFYALMHRDFATTGVPDPPEVPAGYRVRGIDPVADRELLHSLDDAAFRARPDYKPEGVEEFDRKVLSWFQFDASFSLIAETDGGVAAGFLIGWRDRERDVGIVAILGVLPDHRRHAIGRTLLLDAFARIGAAGLPAAELFVASDNPNALKLYGAVEMREIQRHDVWMRAP
jgi:mycothiol synthase